jgi:minor extracellular serine protease Vpr
MRITMPRARLSLLAILILVLSASLPALADDDTLDGELTSATDNDSPSNWFVELAVPPTSDGASLDATVASKNAFRAAARAKGIGYAERFAYGDLWNGFSVSATAGNVARLQGIPGVKAIWPVITIGAADPGPGTDERIDLATAIQMTGADYVQNTLGFTGKNIKVGVIDTGIDYDNPDLGGCFGPSCRVFTGTDFVGNAFDASGTGAALIPVPDPDPDDCAGHGTHVSGIVGANGGVTGVAPDVRFGAYRVFGCVGSTTSDVMLAAMERALADHMDVINMSIGAAFQWPQYPTAVGADRLVRKHGIVVVASIGNSGANGLYSAGAPGVGESVIGVASFDNIETQLPVFTLSGDNAQIGYLQATSSPNAPLSGSAPLARTGTPASTADGCSALPAASLAGRIVLIRRGTCGFYNKALNAQTAGAIGVVIYNNVPGYISATVAPVAPLTTEITIPVVTTSDTLGAIVNAHIAAGPTTLTWTADTARFGMPTGNLISSFSSYGLAPDLSLKPDIGAPGGSIWSTYPLELGGHANLSGTSMASPHVAGAVALLLQAMPRNLREDRPDLVRGLLQNTANPHLWFGNPGLGFLDGVNRQGAGMLNIRAAIEANAYVTPSKLSLGESQTGPVVGPVTRTLTITSKPGAGDAITYTFSHAPALANGANTFTPAFFNAVATVTFSTPSVTVKNNQSASVNVSITAPSGTAITDGTYGGYVVATGTDGSTLRVPYAGYIGDYQSRVVLTNIGGSFGANSGRVCRATTTPGSFLLQPFASPGGTFTFADALQVPFFCQHFNHQSRTVTFTARNTATNTTYVAETFNYFGRSSSATSFFAIDWDGASGDGDARAPVPNGIYEIGVNVLKALGDPTNPAHTEHATIGFLTIARP